MSGSKQAYVKAGSDVFAFLLPLVTQC